MCFCLLYSPRVTNTEVDETQLVTKYRCCDGWTGDTCDQALCTPACQNFGNCAAPNLCQCDQTKWTGPSCEQGINIASNPLLFNVTLQTYTLKCVCLDPK